MIEAAAPLTQLTLHDVDARRRIDLGDGAEIEIATLAEDQQVTGVSWQGGTATLSLTRGEPILVR